MVKHAEPNILIVEDTEEHAVLLKRALQRGKLKPNLFVARDGQAALDYLHNHGDYADRKASPRPDLILLDLKLPKVSGLEVLQHIKNNEDLKDIHVVVLTSSDEGRDIIQSYERGAESYLTKSVLFVKKSGDMSAMLDAVMTMASLEVPNKD